MRSSILQAQFACSLRLRPLGLLFSALGLALSSSGCGSGAGLFSSAGIFSTARSKAVPESVISGTVLPLVGRLAQIENGRETLFSSTLLWNQAVASGCETALASLYALDPITGARLADPVTSVALDSQAKYTIENLGALGVALKSSSTVNYVVEVTGCDLVFSRPVTEFDDQDVSASSTLISYVVNSGAAKRLTQIERAWLALFLLKLPINGDLDITISYEYLINNPSLSAEFTTVFGSHPNVLNDAVPRVLVINRPTSVNELSPASFQVSATHWSPNYPVAYLWKRDGSEVSTSQNYTYTPSPNEQGIHSIALYVGKSTGAPLGALDATLPYQVWSFSLLVRDSIPATPPELALEIPASNTSARAITLSLNTGAGMSNCVSFSSLAITENSIYPPTDPAAYSITCTDEDTQNIPYSLSSAGDGSKTLFLWAIDSSENISVVPSSFSVTLDTQDPSVAIVTDLAGVSLKGGSSLAVAISASDSGTGVATLILRYASDGENYEDVASLSTSATNYQWNVPLADSSTAKLRLIATDGAGNSTTATTSAFTIDSTPPDAPNVTLTSATLAKNSLVSMTIADCTDRPFVLINEGPAPSSNDAAWQECVEELDYTVSDDGLHVINVWAKDLVGNVSVSPGIIEMTYDSTPPDAPSATRASSELSNSSNITITITDCSDRTAIFVNEADQPSSSAEGWQACSTGVGAIAYTLPNATEGVRSMKVWAIDLAGNVSTSSATVTMTYDVTPPSVNSVTINDGDAYVGTPSITVRVAATDNLSTLQVRLTEAHPATSDCQSEYADNSWQAYSGASQEYGAMISALDGTKSICVWGKDASGNVSVIDPSSGTVGVNMDTINFEVGAPPVVSAFSVTNANDSSKTYSVGDPVNISWTVTDTVGLSNSPITLEYSTDNTTWTAIVSNYGELNGNPTSYTGSYTSWTSPSASYFRVRIVATDQAGNTSVAVLSDTMNTNYWSIFAGTTDRGVGGGASSALLDTTGTGSYFLRHMFAIHPTTNDVYALDHGYGIAKLDARTGIVSKFLSHTNSWPNLPTNGAFTSSSTVITHYAGLAFDSNGYLYIHAYGGYANGTVPTGKIFRLDLQTSQSILYVGGGYEYNAATPTEMYVAGGGLAFDESNSLYFFTDCTIGVNASGPLGYRIMKLTQDPTTKLPGSISIVAGDCTNGSPTSGANALSTPITSSSYPYIGNISVWNNGSVILYSFLHSNVYKILNGTVYSSSFSGTSNSFFYNRKNSKVYSAAGGAITEYTVNTGGANGDTGTTFVSGSGSGDGDKSCTSDGVSATASCVVVTNAYDSNSNGTVFFADGPKVNGPRPYRIRYKDDAGKVQTLLGSMAFYGDGLDKNLIRGSLGGIYYKQSTEPNTVAFPPGLYFVDYLGLIFGHIDAETNLTRVVAGNQQGNDVNHQTGTSFSPTTSLGNAYYPNLAPLIFDLTGLPWFRHQSGLTSVNEDLQIIRKQSGGSYWDIAPNAVNATLFPLATTNNIALKDNGIFLMGVYRYTRGIFPNVIQYHNYDTNTVTHVMGTSSDGAAADNSTPGSAQNATLSTTCLEGPIGYCYLVYRSDEDRLYFSEDNKIRYITTPTDSAASTLGTILSLAAGNYIYSFIFSTDGKQIFYIGNNYNLYCHDISSGKEWCNDTSLGPASGMPSMTLGPNQLTWESSSSLLISTYTGYIYRYTLPP